MAARSLSFSLSKTLSAQKHYLSPSRLISIRHQSTTNNNNNNSNPIDLSETDTSSSSDTLLMQKVEDAIQRIMVEKSQPDWIPFVPGSSYWISPQRSRAYGVQKLAEKLVEPLTEDESLSTAASNRGWPSADYFIRGGSD